MEVFGVDIAAQITQLMTASSEEAWMVYLLIVVFMFASSLGLPIPEELMIVTVGGIAHLSYTTGDGNVEPVTAAFVCFAAVFISDNLVYYLGRYLRPQLEKIRYFRTKFRRRKSDVVQQWMQKYGFWSAGFFRFTPGMRFPGHLACGMFGVRPIQFALVDGLAALVSVPTQVLLISYFGKEILSIVLEFKYVFLGLVLAIIIFIVRHRIYKNRQRNTEQWSKA